MARGPLKRQLSRYLLKTIDDFIVIRVRVENAKTYPVYRQQLAGE